MNPVHLRLAATAVAIVASLSPLALSAQVATMDFSSIVHSNGALLPQTFGDRAGLNVSNTTLYNFGNAAAVPCASVSLFNAGYSDLTSAAYGCAYGTVGELSFTPAAGKQVTLESLRLGSWESTNGVGPLRSIDVRIYDASWTSVFNYVGTITSGFDLAPNITSSSTLYVQWGYDWNTGVNLVTTNIADIPGLPPVSTVPEPSTIALLATGLGALLITAKRRQYRA